MVNVNGVTGARGRATDTSTDFVSTAMRTIRNLQKQWRDLGERYQQELAHPHTAGPAEQDLLRDLARQMASIKQEIEAEENAILEHQALMTLKKRNSAEKSRLPEPASQPASGSTPADGSAAAHPSDVRALKQVNETADRDATPDSRTSHDSLGQNIDTQA